MPPKVDPKAQKAPSGTDKFIFKNGSKYEGEYTTVQNNVVRQGYGKYIEALTTLDPNDVPGLEPDEINAQITQIFEGTWDNDQFVEGTITFADGSKYEGKLNAEGNYLEGTYTFVDGSKWVGPFKMCRMNGEGIFIDKSGKKWKGIMEDNQCEALIELK